MYYISKKEIFNCGKLIIKEGDPEYSRVCGPMDVAYIVPSDDGSEIICRAGDVVGCFLRDNDECPECPEMIQFILGIPEFEHYLRRPFTEQTQKEYENWLDTRPNKLECCECFKFFHPDLVRDIKFILSPRVVDFLVSNGHTEGYLCNACYDTICFGEKDERELPREELK